MTDVSIKGRKGKEIKGKNRPGIILLWEAAWFSLPDQENPFLHSTWQNAGCTSCPHVGVPCKEAKIHLLVSRFLFLLLVGRAISVPVLRNCEGRHTAAYWQSESSGFEESVPSQRCPTQGARERAKAVGITRAWHHSSLTIACEPGLVSCPGRWEQPQFTKLPGEVSLHGRH